MAGNAIRVGGEMLMNAMRKSDGTFRTYQEMVDEKIDLKYTGVYTAPGTVADANNQGIPFVVYMYGLFIAEVAVDMETGKDHSGALYLGCRRR